MRHPDGENEAPPLLRMQGITKAFDGVEVLADVGLELRTGEVHVLAGENGAGKTTLIKIIAGVYDDYRGTVELRGARMRFGSPHDAARQGIAVIYQEMSLIGSMSVMDNLLLGREPRWGGIWIDQAEQKRRARKLLESVGLDIDVARMTDEYSPAVRQLIEIAKALSLDAKIIVMDEPTSSLSEPEVDRLFELIGTLKARGCGIVYISHKMEEIYRIADRITVLRDGRIVGTAPAADLPQSELIRSMVGREISQQFPAREAAVGETRLQVRDLGVHAPVTLHGISLEVREGEIVGVAGVQGSGNSELLQAIFGAYGPPSRGEVVVDGVRLETGLPHEAIDKGLVLLTNDRKGNGLFPAMDIVQNMTIAALNRFAHHGWVNRNDERAAATKRAETLQLKYASLDQSVTTLSGGNQQKVMLAKWLETTPKVLLLDEPTRGVDVGVKHDIYGLMNRLTRSGCSILWVTSEMPELLAMSDRILVMERGRISTEFTRLEATQERVLRAALGG